MAESKIPTSESSLQKVISRLRAVTSGTQYDGKLYLVGGLLRDMFLNLPAANDLDLVLEGDAVKLAMFLHDLGCSAHYPVLYPRFGTAMVHIRSDSSDEIGFPVELVSARAESYIPDSRKPDVIQGSLHDDAFRRDFTINTLLENLHTGEKLDITGRAYSDLQAGLIRTPKEPRITFFDDPLRMLRAVRFAAKLGFVIEKETWNAVIEEAQRLKPPAIAHERIRDEFIKIMLLPGSQIRIGMELLRTSGLLDQFLPEMLPMVGCLQGSWHLYDVWNHTLTAMENLPEDASLELRLGLLWHDVGKPTTRTVDDRGVHFYGHPAEGARIARTMMNHLRFKNEEIRDVSALVEKHMRLGEYKSQWADPPVKRLIRDAGDYLNDLFELARCDIAASNIEEGMIADLSGLRSRIDSLNETSNIAQIESPLDGSEIMEILGVQPGPHLREAKEFLTNEIIEGRLTEGDKSQAEILILEWWNSQNKF